MLVPSITAGPHFVQRLARLAHILDVNSSLRNEKISDSAVPLVSHA